MTKPAPNAAHKSFRRLPALFLLMVALAAAPALAAADAFALFEQFIADERTTRMQFRQVVSDEKGAVLESARGTLWYQPPNRFRMEFDDGADHPLIVSDGETLWLYEADIKQLTIRSLQSTHQSGLHSILSGGGLDALRKDYILTAGLADDLVWLNAEAHKEVDSVRTVRLGFDGDSGALRRVNINDVFNSTIQLDISDIHRQAEDAQLFSFSPPPGTDIYTVDE